MPWKITGDNRFESVAEYLIAADIPCKIPNVPRPSTGILCNIQTIRGANK